MKQLCVVVVLIWYICVQENYLFTRADANIITVNIDFDDKSRNISCDNSLWINIHDISVREESISCKNTYCKLNKKDTDAIKDCNGKSICKLDWIFKTECLKEYGYFNISYMCKAICDFEDGICQFKISEDSSTWEIVTSIEIPTLQNTNTTMITDHTTGKGSFMIIRSSSISSGEMKSLEIKSKGEKCLTFWYMIYGDVNFEIWNRHGIKTQIPQARKGEWLNHRFDIYLEDTDHIIFKVKFSTSAFSVVALDDVSLTEGICNDVITRIQPCIPTDEEYTFAGCQSFFLSEIEINLMYNVSVIGQVCQNSTQMKETIDSHCDRSDDWKRCKFKLKDLLNNVEDKCFQPVKKLSIAYSCTDTPMLPGITSIAATQPTNVMSSVYTRAATSTETDDSTMATEMHTVLTTFKSADSTMATEMHTVLTTFKSADIPENISSSSASSTSVIGIVVGVVLSLIALSVLLVIAVIYLRRSRYVEKKTHSIVANEDSHSDYTGHQNTTFSSEVNVTTQTDYCEIRKPKFNEHYHDITDTFSPSINTTIDDEYSEIANILNSPNSNPNASTNYQQQYISLDHNATGFDRSIPQNNLHNESKYNHNSNEKTSFTGGDDYAILDPDDLNESKNNTPKVLPLSENYVVLDPTETGFNSQENTDTVCNYELATPINPTETSEDPYDVSKDETYDTSSNSRHKEKDNNIYSHMVDNVYDTAGNQRKKEDNDGTYDHFFGQQSEDDYDISKPL